MLQRLLTRPLLERYQFIRRVSRAFGALFGKDDRARPQLVDGNRRQRRHLFELEVLGTRRDVDHQDGGDKEEG